MTRTAIICEGPSLARVEQRHLADYSQVVAVNRAALAPLESHVVCVHDARGRVLKALEPQATLDLGRRELWAPFEDDLARYYDWGRDTTGGVVLHSARWAKYHASLPFPTRIPDNAWSYRSLFVAIAETIRTWPSVTAIDVWGADMQGRENYLGETTQKRNQSWALERKRFARIVKEMGALCGVRIRRRFP